MPSLLTVIACAIGATVFLVIGVAAFFAYSGSLAVPRDMTSFLAVATGLWLAVISASYLEFPNVHVIIIIIIKIETTLQPEAELRGLHIITCTTYKYIINTIL